MTGDNYKTKVLQEAFEKDFKDKNIVFLSRDEIQDNPFFKYNDYGNLNFDMFEKMVIGIIDTNKIDVLAVFDVEANGFGNSKIMNIGAMNYNIKKDSGTSMGIADFKQNLYENSRGEEFLLNSDQKGELKTISLNEKDNLSWQDKKRVVFQRFKGVDGEEVYQYYYYEGNLRKLRKKMVLPFEQIKNYIEKPDDGVVIYNRTIEANMSAYLIKDKDFKVPQEMINLTGINQELLEKYGIETAQVDKEMSEFYKGKKVLFGAHNSPYDARVLRANLPKLYETLKENDLYDSALFTKEQKLAYDDVDVVYFNNVSGLSSSILFNSNHNSDYNIVKFLERNQNGYYPDRDNNFLLEIEDGNYYLVDKVKHEKIKIEADENELLSKLNFSSMPKNKLKYSVEKLSEQWMVHSVLLCDQDFDIKKVIIDGRYEELKKHEDALKFFQENYHFDTSFEANFTDFIKFYQNLGQSIQWPADSDEFLKNFMEDFLKLNKDIQQKFSDSWMYKAVLGIKEPESNDDITNDLVDLVQFQTALPKEKIVTIFKEALAFKKKYKIDHIIQHESHVNGPWESDMKGDIAFEDKLTMSLLAQRYYDPYNHKVDNAIKEFNLASLKARYAFEKSDKLSDELAQDSYSFRQGLLYDRVTKTDLIKGIQSKEDKLQVPQEHVVNLKLDNDILNADTHVVAILKADSTLNREQLEADSKKLSFICANEQLKYAMKQSSLNSVKMKLEDEDADDTIVQMRKNNNFFDSVLNILEANDKISLEYKKDLGERYRFIEFNKKVEQMKDLLEFIEIKLYGLASKRKNVKIDDIGLDGFKVVKEIVDKYITTADRTYHTRLKPENIEAAKQLLMKIEIEELKPSSLELALKDTSLNFTTFQEVSDNNFLRKVNINRQKPIKLLLEKFSGLRLVNQFIENQNIEYGNSLDDENQKTLKLK